MNVKNEIVNFLEAYISNHNDHSDQKLNYESIEIDEAKFLNWCKKGLGSNTITEKMIASFDDCLDIYNEEINVIKLEDTINSYIKDSELNKLDACSKLLRETDYTIKHLRGYDEFEDFLETDIPKKYKIADKDCVEGILFKAAMLTNLWACKMLSEEIFHVLDNCNVMNNDLTFEIFDQFVLNRQQEFTKDQIISYGSEFMEPKSKKLQGLYRDFCLAEVLPEVGMLFKNSEEDNQRSFRDYVKDFFNVHEDENDPESFSLELSDEEIEEIAQCEAINYSIACLFNSDGEHDPDDLVITKDDYQNFIKECSSDLTPEKAHQLADCYQNILIEADKIKISDDIEKGLRR